MKNKAFTLIEIMVAIAIVGILAAVVLVSMNTYGKKARASKALAQVSSVIPNMVSCWGNGGTPTAPVDSGGNICNRGGDSYGKWPVMGSGDLSGYTYWPEGIYYNYDSNWKNNHWFIGVWGTNDQKMICCNSAMNSCKMMDTSTAPPCSSDPQWCTSDCPAS